MSAAAPRLQFANYEEMQPTVPFNPKCRPHQDRFEQPTGKKASRSVVDVVQEGWEKPAKEFSINDPLKGLDVAYVVVDRGSVARFIKEHRLRGLLLQAIEPLNEAFSRQTINVLSLVVDDEGFETLFCLAMISGEMEGARNALREFDQHWWLERSNKAAGRLNFDFELI